MKTLIKAKNGPTWRAVLPYINEGRTIIGVDEVGRGAWAGPVVVAAVVLPPKLNLPGLDDSKLLSPKARRRLNRQIRSQAQAVGIAWVPARDIDRHGLTWALNQAGRRAVASLQIQGGIVILDGKHNYLAEHLESVALAAADRLVVPVAAASVVAKVARDSYMTRLSVAAAGYGFEAHKGYGTAYHRDAIMRLGLSEHHRRSWAPFSNLVKNS